jgi:hypothetical protein
MERDGERTALSLLLVMLLVVVVVVVVLVLFSSFLPLLGANGYEVVNPPTPQTPKPSRIPNKDGQYPSTPTPKYVLCSDEEAMNPNESFNPQFNIIAVQLQANKMGVVPIKRRSTK